MYDYVTIPRNNYVFLISKTGFTLSLRKENHTFITKLLHFWKMKGLFNSTNLTYVKKYRVRIHFSFYSFLCCKTYLYLCIGKKKD